MKKNKKLKIILLAYFRKFMEEMQIESIEKITNDVANTFENLKIKEIDPNENGFKFTMNNKVYGKDKLDEFIKNNITVEIRNGTHRESTDESGIIIGYNDDILYFLDENFIYLHFLRMELIDNIVIKNDLSGYIPKVKMENNFLIKKYLGDENLFNIVPGDIGAEINNLLGLNYFDKNYLKQFNLEYEDLFSFLKSNNFIIEILCENYYPILYSKILEVKKDTLVLRIIGTDNIFITEDVEIKISDIDYFSIRLKEDKIRKRFFDSYDDNSIKKYSDCINDILKLILPEYKFKKVFKNTQESAEFWLPETFYNVFYLLFNDKNNISICLALVKKLMFLYENMSEAIHIINKLEQFSEEQDDLEDAINIYIEDVYEKVKNGLPNLDFGLSEISINDEKRPIGKIINKSDNFIVSFLESYYIYINKNIENIEPVYFDKLSKEKYKKQLIPELLKSPNLDNNLCKFIIGKIIFLQTMDNNLVTLLVRKFNEQTIAGNIIIEEINYLPLIFEFDLSNVKGINFDSEYLIKYEEDYKIFIKDKKLSEETKLYFENILGTAEDYANRYDLKGWYICNFVKSNSHFLKSESKYDSQINFNICNNSACKIYIEMNLLENKITITSVDVHVDA